MINDGAVVFVGPTLTTSQASTLFEADVRPPAKRGDIYRAALEEPRAILLIDGSFEDVPAVFHKEILWALDQGIHVFGASSLGALRAAELDVFGMVGVGKIYEAYRDGYLERDDAVAVLHGPAELGWPLLTRALVDIEATLNNAEAAGVLSPIEHADLLRTARKTFWKERDYGIIVERTRTWSGTAKAFGDFLAWLPNNEVEQKKLDALALFRSVAEGWDSLEEPLHVNFRFERTVAWQALKTEIDWEIQGISHTEFEEIKARLRSDGILERFELESLACLLAEDAADGVAGISELNSAAQHFRRARNLRRGEAVGNWMMQTGLTHAGYLALVQDFLNLERARAKEPVRFASALLRVLRGRGMLLHQPSNSTPEEITHDGEIANPRQGQRHIE